MVADRNLSDLADIVHPDAEFRSPMAITPYATRDAVLLILGTVMEVFEDFEYHRTFVADDSRSVVLEFSARVGDRLMAGVDMITFDDDGLITGFEVMIRPQSGLQALGAEMGRRLAEILPQFKA
jgi:hypothetical protein